MCPARGLVTGKEDKMLEWTEKYIGTVVVPHPDAGRPFIPLATSREIALIGRGHEMGDIKLSPDEFSALEERGRYVRGYDVENPLTSAAILHVGV